MKGSFMTLTAYFSPKIKVDNAHSSHVTSNLDFEQPDLLDHMVC